FRDREDAQRYREAVARALEAGRTGRPGMVEVIRVQRSSGKGHFGMIIRPGWSRLREPQTPMAGSVAVFLSAEPGERDASTASVRKLFGLTEKEAQLALSLANGHTLQEFADEFDMSLNTARAHLRAIYAKIGVDRQPKLVRVTLTSVAALGRRSPPTRTPMPIDPAFRALLELPGAELRPPPPELGAAGLRAALAANPLPPVEKEAVHEVRELTVRGAADTLRVRLYRPSAATELPLVVFFHGGGFVMCDLETHDPLCRSLARASNCAVASVEYRLAPEARFP